MLKKNAKSKGLSGMRGKLIPYVAGALTTLTLIGSASPALAAGNARTLTAYPVQVLVDGEVFRPTTGEVFLVDGTTYAPVRALAEAYGLEVGYDHARNLVTVNAGAAQVPAALPPAASASFASQWTVKQKPVTNYGDQLIYTASYSGDLGMGDFKTWWKSFGGGTIRAEAEAMAREVRSLVGGNVVMYFDYSGWSLGTVYAFGYLEQSDFAPAGVWIK